MKKEIIGVFFCMLFSTVAGQTTQELQKLSWKQLRPKCPKNGTEAPRQKTLQTSCYYIQSDLGGFPKNIAFHKEIRQDIIDKQKETGIGTTIDNNATTTEMRFLTNMYAQTHDQRYKDAFFKALDYIYLSQYDNGGWPQFYPYRKGKSVAYSRDITYNDGAIVNVLKMLYAISDDDKPYVIFEFTPEQKQKPSMRIKKVFNVSSIPKYAIKTANLLYGVPNTIPRPYFLQMHGLMNWHRIAEMSRPISFCF